MKIALISKNYQGGYLYKDAVNFLKERGFVDEEKELEKETPTADWLDRTEPLLIEAIEKYAEYMECLEVLDVPEGDYVILRFCEIPHGGIKEVLVKANGYWTTSNGVVEIPVENQKTLNEIKMNIFLFNRLDGMGIKYLHELKKLSRTELVKKCVYHERQKFKKELDDFVEEFGVKLAD